MSEYRGDMDRDHEINQPFMDPTKFRVRDSGSAQSFVTPQAMVGQEGGLSGADVLNDLRDGGFASYAGPTTGERVGAVAGDPLDVAMQFGAVPPAESRHEVSPETEVLTGEIMEAGGRPRPYSDVPTGPRVSMHGTPALLAEPLARYVQSDVERYMAENPGKDIKIVNVDFTQSPGVSVELLETVRGLAESGVAIDLTDSKVTDKDGVLRSLNDDELADLVAVASSGGEYDKAMAARRLLREAQVAYTNATMRTDDESGAVSATRPTPEQVRDIFRLWRGDFSSRGATPALPDDAELRVKLQQSLNIETRQRNGDIIESVALHLEAFTADSSHATRLKAEQNGDEAGARAAMVSVRVEGTGLMLSAQRRLLSGAIASLAADATILVVGGIEKVEPNALDETIEFAEGRHIKLYTTLAGVAGVPDALRVHAGKGTLVIARPTSSDEANALSTMLGTTTTDEVTGTTNNLSITEGGGLHEGGSVNLKKTGGLEGGGRSSNTDQTWSGQLSITQNVTHNPAAPRVPAAAFEEDMRPNEILVVDGSRENLRVYNMFTGQVLDENFPPSRGPELIDAEAKFYEVTAQLGRGDQPQLAEPAGTPALPGTPRQAPQAGGVIPFDRKSVWDEIHGMSMVKLETQFQESQRLERDFTRDTGGKLGGIWGSTVVRGRFMSWLENSRFPSEYSNVAVEYSRYFAKAGINDDVRSGRITVVQAREQGERIWNKLTGGRGFGSYQTHVAVIREFNHQCDLAGLDRSAKTDRPARDQIWDQLIRSPQYGLFQAWRERRGV